MPKIKKKTSEMRRTLMMLGIDRYRALIEIYSPSFLLNILKGLKTFISLTILNMPKSTLAITIEKIDNITMKKSN